MNIHLVNDEKFINKFVEDFESFYPDQNLYIVKDSYAKKFGKTKYVHIDNEKVFLFSYESSTFLEDIMKLTPTITNVFIHCLDISKAFLAIEFKKIFNCKTYWIFYGGDLYGWLHAKGKYKIYDNESFPSKLKTMVANLYRSIHFSMSYRKSLFSVKKKLIEELDYFCFWNWFDFELLKTHFNTKAIFKPFLYLLLPTLADFEKYHPKKINILINQSGSKSGNHLTILKKLVQLDENSKINMITIPLSYGNEKVINSVKHFCNVNFSSKFNPVTTFLEREKYTELIGKHSVAIYGHRRQEAGGNIFLSLALGLKVFLRRENNLLKYLKEKGFYVFEFEDELNTVLDLLPLQEEKVTHNRSLFMTLFSKENTDKMYKELIN